MFTGSPGKYVDLKDTISGFKGILDGKYDDLPEMAFYMVGDIEEVKQKAERMAKELAARKDTDKKVGRVHVLDGCHHQRAACMQGEGGAELLGTTMLSASCAVLTSLALAP